MRVTINGRAGDLVDLVAFIGSLPKTPAWVCPNGQQNRGKDLICWDTPCACGAKRPEVSDAPTA